jgi:hypothetical protein
MLICCRGGTHRNPLTSRLCMMIHLVDIWHWLLVLRLELVLPYGLSLGHEIGPQHLDISTDDVHLSVNARQSEDLRESHEVHDVDENYMMISFLDLNHIQDPFDQNRLFWGRAVITAFGTQISATTDERLDFVVIVILSKKELWNRTVPEVHLPQELHEALLKPELVFALYSWCDRVICQGFFGRWLRLLIFSRSKSFPLLILHLTGLCQRNGVKLLA